jgi:hypothetical protein
MSPEEKLLLERTLKISEENNEILKKLNTKARWAFIWGIIKIALVVTPIIIGILILQPLLEPIKEMFEHLVGNIPVTSR